MNSRRFLHSMLCPPPLFSTFPEDVIVMVLSGETFYYIKWLLISIIFTLELDPILFALEA